MVPPPTYAPVYPPSADGAADGTGDTLAQLKELAELRSQGVLTDAEFEDQKRRILGS